MTRHHALDACRAAAMLWGLFFHAAVSFMTIPIGWAVRDVARSPAVDAFMWISHAFRMPVFFLLAGFFARLIWTKQGPAGFLRHRARRLLLPFVIFLIPILPALGGLWIWGLSKSGEAFPAAAPGIRPWRGEPSPGHLWFLYYLILLCAGLWALVTLASRLPLGRLHRGLDVLIAGAVRGHAFPLLLAIPTAGTLYFMHGLEVETPLTFVPSPKILAFYAVFMASGWWLHRQPALVEGLGRRLWIPALAALAVLLLLGPIVERFVATQEAALRLKALGLSALFTGSLVTLFVGLFVRYLSAPRPWVAWLADSSYWSYLVHLPVCVALQVWIADKPWPGLLKYGLVAGGTLAFCLGTYAVAVRRTAVGVLLNGRR
jgi:fucose 4-O-acetylase-like acetyltransferase